MSERDEEITAWKARLDDAEAALDVRELEWLGLMSSTDLAAHADERDRIADERDEIARGLGRLAAQRDGSALARDANASLRDQRSRRPLDEPDPGFGDRTLAGMDRDFAAGDRAEAVIDREEAAEQRDRAADARAHAAGARRAAAEREADLLRRLARAQAAEVLDEVGGAG